MNKQIINFEPDDLPRADIEVFNLDDKEAYVQVEVLQVFKSGMPDEERRKITDLDQINLIVTPEKIIIPPKGRRLVRVMYLETPKNEDQIFRATFKPVIKPFEDRDNKTKTSTNISILVAYQVLIMIQPEQPRIDIQATREGRNLALVNKGNTNVYLRNGKQCSAGTPTECVELENKHIYVNNDFTIKLPYDSPVEYLIKAGNSYSEKKQFP